jgi:hypothetical protein
MTLIVNPDLKNTVIALVSEQVNSVYDILRDNLQNLVTFTQELENQLADFDIPISDIDFQVPTLEIEPFLVAAPVAPDIETDFNVPFPGEPALTQIPVDTVAMPSHNIDPPIIADRADPNIPDLPFDLAAPAINMDFQLPQKPNLQDLTAPAQASIVIPSFAGLDLPEWEGEFPVDDLGEISATYSYAEPVYDSDLHARIRDWVTGIIENGGTGLGIDVLNALRANFRSWLDEDLEEEYEKILKFEASRGFTVPTGALNARLRTFWNRRQRKVQEYDNQLLSEEAKLAQGNTQFAVQYAAEVEKITREAHNQLANRMLQVAKDTVSSAIEIYNGKVAGYNAVLDAVKTRAAVFETRVRAAGVMLDQYKAEIEAQKLTLEAKGQEVQIYAALQQTNAQLVDMWLKETEASKVLLEAERGKIEVFKAQIDAYTAQIGAQKNKVDLHATLLQGDEARIKVYSEQMRGYGILSESVNAQNQVAIERAKLAHDVLNRGQIEVHNAALTRADTLMKALMAAEAFKLQKYEGESKAYEAQARAYQAETDARSKAYSAQLNYAAAMIDKVIKQAEINQQALLAAFNARLETLKARIATWTQTVASCLSTINNSLSLGYSGSIGESVSWQGNEPVNHSHSHTYCEKDCEKA